MAVGDVADLVPDDGGQFRLVCDGGHQAAGDEDEPARECERIDRGIVHHVKFPGELGPLRRFGHLLADGGDVALDRRIVVVADGLRDLLSALLAHLDLLAFRDERQLGLSGHGIGRACGRERDREHREAPVHGNLLGVVELPNYQAKGPPDCEIRRPESTPAEL